MSYERHIAAGSDRCAIAASGIVFVVSDDPTVLDSVAELAASSGLHSEVFGSVEAWLEAVPPRRRGCLVLDAGAGDFAGPERLVELSSICAGTPVLVLIDRGDVPTAVRAIKVGAMDVLEKPCRNANLLESITRLVEAGART